ncbi:unnamed protein product [Rotaria sp. Silwood1]|nr:unnamed protein product [Rotaria sp. Silwood1]CAF3324014.1 unnamed protein product [Rotaria sp. Silwood1]CAF3340636.1 unnamed protein product [Rotaria sp. Silwood1]CAF3349131.1 unnamed protein product [Rotaria sp. Silwood1]
MGEVLNDQVADKNSSKYHTIDICPNLQPVKKDYQTNAPEHQPNANYWIKEVDKEGDETRYKIQHVIANGPHTSSKVNHAIFSAFLYAYNSHEDIVLSPDDIWLMVCIYFSTYVNQNVEQLRTLFVDHEDRKLLTIVQVGLIEPE